MKKKIVFLDIDGTIVDHYKHIPEETVKAIRTLRKNGTYVAIATGRAPFMIEEIRKALDINSFVCFNGQYVVFEGKTVYKNPLSVEQLAALHEKTKETGHSMVFQSNQEMRASVKEDPFITESLKSLKYEYPEVDPDFFYKAEVYQALLFCDSETEAGFRNTSDQLRFVRWHDFSCDVLPGGGSKAVGVERLIEASGLDIKDSFAFGDGLNDLEMIQHAGVGVAMGNAVPELKAVADYVTDSVDQAGLAKGLAHFGLLSELQDQLK